MQTDEDFLALDDHLLLAQCEMNITRSTGPGGQHRNKVATAVRLRHKPTGITATGDDSRSQHDNKRMALVRLRMNIALQHRRLIDPAAAPSYVSECIFEPRGKVQTGLKRLQIGRKDHRFWHVASYLLDALDAYEGQLAAVAGHLGIGSSNLASILQEDRHLLAAAQTIRKRFGKGPIL